MGNPQAFTEARRVKIEQRFQDNKAEIQADFESIELSMADLERKWDVHNRTVRRWMERLGIDPIERTYARRRAGLEKKSGPKNPKPRSTIHDDLPQASKLVGLW